MEDTMERAQKDTQVGTRLSLINAEIQIAAEIQNSLLSRLNMVVKQTNEKEKSKHI